MKLIVCIVGPTAAGKTAVGVELAKYFETEIISADSRQVYRFMDIGTNKIKPDEMKGVPHHLINIIDPNENYNAGQFSRDAEQIYQTLKHERELLLVVGGTDLYIKAWLEGLDQTPVVPEEVRNEVNNQFETEGLTTLLRELEE